MTGPTFGGYPVAADGTVTFDPDLIQPGIGQRLEPPAGVCSSVALDYDFGPPLDDRKLSRAVAAVRAANDLDQPDEIVARRAVEAYMRHIIEDDLPVISAPRGGIVYKIGDWVPPAPPRFPRVARTWKATRVRVAQLRAAVRRVQDAHAVWAGTKQALTDHEIDELRDDD